MYEVFAPVINTLHRHGNVYVYMYKYFFNIKVGCGHIFIRIAPRKLPLLNCVRKILNKKANFWNKNYFRLQKEMGVKPSKTPSFSSGSVYVYMYM